jgi:hypothetical protein
VNEHIKKVKEAKDHQNKEASKEAEEIKKLRTDEGMHEDAENKARNDGKRHQEEEEKLKNDWNQNHGKEEEKLIKGGKEDHRDHGKEKEKLIKGGKEDHQDHGKEEELINGGKQDQREEEKPRTEGSGLTDTEKGFPNFFVSPSDKEKRKEILKRRKVPELTTETQIKKEMEKLEKNIQVKNDYHFTVKVQKLCLNK